MEYWISWREIRGIFLTLLFIVVAQWAQAHSGIPVRVENCQQVAGMDNC
jgi:hypothetical protein